MDTFLNAVLTTLAVPLTAMLCAACYTGTAWLKARARAQDMSNLDHEAHISIGAGIQAMSVDTPSLLTDGIKTVEQRNSVLSEATNYFRDRFPDRTKQIGKQIDAAEGADIHAAVQQTIAARLLNVISGTTLLPGPGGVASGLPPWTGVPLAGVSPNAAVPP